jgi:hypothetical protein
MSPAATSEATGSKPTPDISVLRRGPYLPGWGRYFSRQDDPSDSIATTSMMSGRRSPVQLLGYPWFLQSRIFPLFFQKTASFAAMPPSICSLCANACSRPCYPCPTSDASLRRRLCGRPFRDLSARSSIRRGVSLPFIDAGISAFPPRIVWVVSPDAGGAASFRLTAKQSARDSKTNQSVTILMRFRGVQGADQFVLWLSGGGTAFSDPRSPR